MKRQTQKVMRGVGVAMAIGSAVAAAGATMGNTNRKGYKKTAQKAMSAVENFVDNVQSMM